MNPADIRAEIATRLKTIIPRSFAYSDSTVPPPFAWLLTDEVDNHLTYGAVGDWTLHANVLVAVGKPDDRSSEAALDAYVATEGDSSVLVTLEGGTYTAFDFIKVTGAKWGVGEFNDVKLRFASFTVEITGSS